MCIKKGLILGGDSAVVNVLILVLKLNHDVLAVVSEIQADKVSTINKILAKSIVL